MAAVRYSGRSCGGGATKWATESLMSYEIYLLSLRKLANYNGKLFMSDSHRAAMDAANPLSLDMRLRQSCSTMISGVANNVPGRSKSWI